MTKAKTAKDWMREFKPALDAAMSCPDVSPMETVELYIEKAIEAERQRCCDIVLSVWTPISEDMKHWRACQRAIHKDIRNTQEGKADV